MAENPLSRRDFIKTATLLGAGAAVGGLGVLAIQQATEIKQPGAAPIMIGERAVTIEELAGGAVQVVTGQWGQQPAAVYKVKRTALEMAAQIRGHDTMAFALEHPDEADHMIVAYNAKCTHLGCTVGWSSDLGASADVADYDGDGDNDGRVLCPCHQAQFDVHNLGEQLAGTPAPKPLGVLRISLEGREIWAREHIPQDAPGAALQRL